VALPAWLPQPIRVYLAHTEGGESIRALARAAGCHASTVLRQVRRTETLRDDPLADSGLARLGRLMRGPAGLRPALPIAQEMLPMTANPEDEAKLARDTLRVLTALMEPKTILVVADGVEDAVVVHDAGTDRPVRRAVLGRDLAEALVLREFISGSQVGRLARYAITPAGRSEARRLMATSESRRAALNGAAEDPSLVDATALFAPSAARGALRKRSAGTDAPYQVLSRRRRADGEAWLPPELVACANRFRESWEIARIGGGATRDWDRLVAGRVGGGGGVAGQGASTRRLEAEQSLEAAIRALGPDLAETILLSVCREEGMEDIEARLDFPARSGKIVLRIALRALARHYAAVGSGDYDMIS
jgi:DNA-directed RNA polymerase specialized sigma24 family protein